MKIIHIFFPLELENESLMYFSSLWSLEFKVARIFPPFDTCELQLTFLASLWHLDIKVVHIFLLFRDWKSSYA